MLIDFNKEDIVDNVVRELIQYDDDIYIDDVYEAVFEEIEEWFANYGLHTDLIYAISKELKEMDIEVHE